MPNHNYLATKRTANALKQAELAKLLFIDGKELSKLENGKRLVNFRLALDLEAVFGMPLSALFPDDFADRVELVISRAASLDQETRDKKDAASQKKQALLAEIVKRARPTPSL